MNTSDVHHGLATVPRAACGGWELPGGASTPCAHEARAMAEAIHRLLDRTAERPQHAGRAIVTRRPARDAFRFTSGA